jgi:hypothetical protein
VSEEYRARTWKGNQAYRTFLVDGFLAGIWQLTEAEETATLTVQAFGTLTASQRDAVVAEGEQMLAALTPATALDIRFGAFAE